MSYENQFSIFGEILIKKQYRLELSWVSIDFLDRDILSFKIVASDKAILKISINNVKISIYNVSSEASEYRKN